MRDALLKSLNREAKKGKPTKRLQAIVDKLVELAMKGDFYAIQEIFDRVDGRVRNRSRTRRARVRPLCRSPGRTHAAGRKGANLQSAADRARRPDGAAKGEKIWEALPWTTFRAA